MQETAYKSVAKMPRLIIRVGHDSLSFAALLPSESGQVMFQPYDAKPGISMPANLREAFKTVAVLQKDWQRTAVLVDTPIVLIPSDFYDESTKEVLYHHAITGYEGQTVLATALPSLSAVALYAVSKDLKLVIEDRFDDVKFLHVCFPVWQHLYRRSFTGVRQKLYAYFHDGQMDVFSFQQNRFKFSNSFPARQVDNAVYFLLNVWQQLAFDSKRDELHIVGQIQDRERLQIQLGRFVQNVYVINPRAEFNRQPITEVQGLPYDLLTYFLRK